MASIVSRPAFRASSRLLAKSERESSKIAMIQEARKNPELYVLFGIMAAVFGGAGYYFSQNPTTPTSEHNVAKVPGSEPWKTGKFARYQYYPYGDTTGEKKDAPSALHVTIIPNVNLPKELHDQFNKYGDDEYP